MSNVGRCTSDLVRMYPNKVENISDFTPFNNHTDEPIKSNTPSVFPPISDRELSRRTVHYTKDLYEGGQDRVSAEENTIISNYLPALSRVKSLGDETAELSDADDGLLSLYTATDESDSSESDNELDYSSILIIFDAATNEFRFYDSDSEL